MTSAEWDREVDVLVIGFGAAGAAAALTAIRLGASVMLAEKQAQDRHTCSTKMSGGLVMTVNDAKAGSDYLSACSGGMIPQAAMQAFAARAASLRRWMEDSCTDLPFTRVNGAEHPNLAGAECIDVVQPGNARFRLDPEAGTGRHLFKALQAAVDRTDADVRWETSARELLQDRDRAVTGAVLDGPAGPIRVRARKGVVLACGGYEFDEQAKLNYLRAYPIHFYGNPGNTGDGLRMAQKAGADLWHMNQMIGRAVGRFRLPGGDELNFMITIDPPGYVITDGDGRRFANEEHQARLLHGFYFELVKFEPDHARYPRIPCYWFFDDTRRRAGPLVNTAIGACGIGLYDWSRDNSAEMALGWIASGETIEAAAAAAGHPDPVAAAESVRAYNETCRTGSGDPFGRDERSLVPLTDPPFHCVKLWPGGSNTTGGPRRDEFSRILDPDGVPIPGLFGAGELGQISGILYPADGSNLSEALCFGQIAVESALSRNTG